MASKIGILGLAAGLLLAAPGIAGAHGHHSEGRNVRQGAHRHPVQRAERHPVQRAERHQVRQSRQHQQVRQHRHVRHHDRRGAHVARHGAYWCNQCRRSFRAQGRFFRHLQHDHRLHRSRVWRHLVRNGWSWIFYG